MPRSTLRIFSVFSTFLLAALCAAPARSAVITYSTQALGGNTYRNTYEVSSEVGEEIFREWTIFFEPSLYANLVAGEPPPNFDVLVIQPDPALPGNGFYDALVVPGANPQGQGDFSVTYSFLGLGWPGRPQRFDVVNPANFAIRSWSYTIPAVPEPGRLPMLLLGMAGLLLIRRQGVPGARSGRSNSPSR